MNKLAHKIVCHLSNLKRLLISPSDLQALLNFYQEQKGTYQRLKSEDPEAEINIYQDDLKGLFENAKVLMYHQISPSDLQALLNFYQEQKGTYQRLKSEDPEAEINIYQDDLKGLFENAKVLMYHQISPSDLQALLNFYQEQKGTYQRLKSEDPEAEINIYQDDLKGLFENAKVLMYHQISPGDLQALLNFYREYKKIPGSQNENIDGLFGDFLKIRQLNMTVEDINELADGQPRYYSQEGEDIILSRFFDGKMSGFYVDVGAHHPKRFSNTYYFYKSGWRGINIEPNPGAKELFDEMRGADVNLNVAAGKEETEGELYVFDDPALNTFSKTLSEEYEKSGHKLMEVIKVKTRKLENILEENLSDESIDFMSIDVEDFELPVLESNNWKKFRPTMLLVEILNFDINHPEKFPAHNFLVDQKYEMWGKTYNTVFYFNKDRLDLKNRI